MARISPEILDERIAEVVRGLREREFLRGTVLEKRAAEMEVDPYSLLLGILIGIAVTLILGMVTIELWLPRALARITGKALEETRRTVMEIITGRR